MPAPELSTRHDDLPRRFTSSSPWSHHELPSPRPSRRAALATSSTLRGAEAASVEARNAAERLNRAGPQGEAAARSTGPWDVAFTRWDAPGAEPTAVTGLIVERRMIGPMLEEILRPARDAGGAPFVRVDDLTFNRVDGRWQYMSMDSRAPFGLLTAASLDADPAHRGFITSAPFATTGNGPVASGQVFRTEQVIERQDADHATRNRYFTPATGAPVSDRRAAAVRADWRP